MGRQQQNDIGPILRSPFADRLLKPEKGKYDVDTSTIGGEEEQPTANEIEKNRDDTLPAIAIVARIRDTVQLVNHDPRRRPDPWQKPCQIRVPQRDAALGRGESRPGQMQENRAAQGTYRGGIVVVADHNDEIVE